MLMSQWFRRLHRWATPLIAITFLIVLSTGILLQLKKNLAWVQPPTAKSSGTLPGVTFDELFAAVRSDPRMQVESWADVNRVDFRPKDGVVKIDANNRWEMQIDVTTGAVLSTAYRRSDLIESIHDGSWFHSSAKLWIFLPSAIILLLLWVTGIVLFIQPWLRKARGRAASSPSGGTRR
ncbi:hypothetical protein MASR2M8_17260 [Opitutaceae bacterium]